MKSLILTGGLLFILLTSSMTFADSQGDAQESLGKAIQEAASIDLAQNGDRGMAQERLGLAIQNASILSMKKQKDQEQLGRLIRDSAFLRYAHGAIQQEMGKTIVELAQG